MKTLFAELPQVFYYHLKCTVSMGIPNAQKNGCRSILCYTGLLAKFNISM